MGYRLVNFLGIPVADITPAETIAQVAQWIEDYHRGAPARQIVTVNPEYIMLALRHPAFRRSLFQAGLITPDGVGLQLLAPLLGGRIRERVTGSDFLPFFAGHAATAGYRLFLLGAAPGVAEGAARKLVEMFPGVQIAGTYAGTPARSEEATISKLVRSANADIVFVAYGAPLQEIWIARNRSRCGAAVLVGVGGAFDHLAGYRKRAPFWFRERGLEWLYRLVTQPWRWRRMLVLPFFVILVLLEGLGRQGRRRHIQNSNTNYTGNGGER